jgi:hypothetical protein
MKRLDERVHLALAAQRLNVDAALIRKWVSRYHLTSDWEGNYRFGDLVEVEWKTRQGRGARRKLTTVG